MRAIRASAPGKAVICGEYAVLHGATAIACAIAARAHVTVAPAPTDTVRIAAPGYLDAAVRATALPGGRLRWIDPLPAPDALGLVECIWARAGGALPRGLDLALDTREFVDRASRQKLGLGSSAALAVALTAALAEMAGTGIDVLATAAAAHRDFQGGRGSGVDVATAWHGGWVAYRVGGRPERRDPIDGLCWRLLWSGRSSNTAVQLSGLGDGGDEGTARLVAAADAAAAAWRRGAAADVLREIAAYTAELGRYAVDRRLGIFEAGHRELADLAGCGSGLVYKPCGAGGGDIGIVFGASPAAVDAFVAQATGRGFTVLDLPVDASGVRVTEQRA